MVLGVFKCSFVSQLDIVIKFQKLGGLSCKRGSNKAIIWNLTRCSGAYDEKQKKVLGVFKRSISRNLVIGAIAFLFL